MKMTDTSLLMTVSDIASLAHVQRPVVSVWRSRSANTDTPFPILVSRQRGIDLFDADQVGSWLDRDNGSSMASKPVAFLLADLGVTKSRSRPHTSNDNPFSESHFKILKYRPEFPDRFYSLAEARSFCTEVYDGYNGEHRHSGTGMHTPFNVYHGRALAES